MSAKNSLKGSLILLAAVVLVVIFTAGCGLFWPPLTSNYFPHVDGYRWDYTKTMTIGTAEPIVANSSNYIDGTTLLPNGLTAVNFVVSEESSSSATIYYYIDGTGVYSYGTSANPTNEAQLLLVLPLEVGDEWSREWIVDATCEAVSIEEVAVPAGTFEAIKVAIGTSGYYEWYADGVGLVKSAVDVVVAGTGETGTYVTELISKNF